MDLAPPREFLSRIDTDARIGFRKPQLAYSVPPAIQVRHDDRHHEILRKLLLVESLKDKVGISVFEPGTAAVLPTFLKSKRGKKPSARVILRAAGDEWRQRIDVER